MTDMNPANCKYMMQMGRRGFLGLLTSGALALLVGGKKVEPEQAEQTVLIDYAWAAMLRGGTVAEAEARWCVPDGKWQIARGTITKDQRVLWLTQDIGIDFQEMWRNET